MSHAAVAATADALDDVDDFWSAPAVAPARSAPDHPELQFPANLLVISAAWWILMIIAVIQGIWS